MSDERMILDDFYSNVLAGCLEQGYWKFAIKSSALAGTSVTNSAHDFNYKVAIPTDWVRTFIISANNTYQPPMLNYVLEGGFLWSYESTIYWRYISNDATSYGVLLSGWPQSSETCVVAAFAAACRPLFAESTVRLGLLKKQEKAALLVARSKDARTEPPRCPPIGTWVRSRRFGSSG